MTRIEWITIEKFVNTYLMWVIRVLINRIYQRDKLMRPY